MSERTYTAMIFIGVSAIAFDALMLGRSVALAISLGVGIVALTVLLEFGIAGLSDG